MKKIALILLVGAIGCGPDPEPSFKYNYTVFNDSGIEIQLICSGCETVKIAVGQTKTLKTNSLFSDYTLAATATTTKKLESEETTTNSFTIWSYEYDVIYVVSGDSNGADVTLKNELGQKTM